MYSSGLWGLEIDIASLRLVRAGARSRLSAADAQKVVAGDYLNVEHGDAKSKHGFGTAQASL